MELIQLHYFRTLARVGNVTKAAEELHITQSALSRAILALEDDIGVKLFERERGKLRINRAGELFLESADNIFVEVQNGLIRVNSLTNDSFNYAHYGVSHLGLLTAGLAAYLRAGNSTRVSEELLYQGTAKMRLETASLDFVISCDPVYTPIGQTWQLYSDYFVVVMSRENPLSELKAAPSDLLENQLLAIISKHNQYDAAYVTPTFSRNVVYEGEDIVLALTLVRENLACLVIQKSYCDWLESRMPLDMAGCAVIPITLSGKRITYDVYFSRLKRRRLPAASEELIAFITQYYSEQRDE